MSSQVLYQWTEEIASHLNSLNSWQKANLARFSYGVVKAASCQQRKVALALNEGEKWESVERRFQRFVSNANLKVSALCREWCRWLWSGMGQPSTITLLVDETKLGEQVGIMMVGIAYEGRCLPLVWHCYDPREYPRCGQVSLILNLLLHVKKSLPAEVDALVLADRGIGTSPQLCRYLDELLAWRYLFRVTCQSKIVTQTGDYTIAKMVHSGEIWASSGKIFKKRGQIPAHARAIWSDGYDEPWALVTNDPHLTGYEYAQRNWQEQSFKDLKSAGFQWDTSHVWKPTHVRRLLLILALAYGWMVALGYRAFQTGYAARPKRSADGRCERRYSIFTEGMIWFTLMLRLQRTVQTYLLLGKPRPPN